MGKSKVVREKVARSLGKLLNIMERESDGKQKISGERFPGWQKLGDI